MSYDVLQYVIYTPGAVGDYPFVYLIVERSGGKPTGLLPESCESVEMGAEFIRFIEVEHPAVDFRWVASTRIRELFAEFLNQREEVVSVRCISCNGFVTGIHTEEQEGFFAREELLLRPDGWRKDKTGWTCGGCRNKEQPAESKITLEKCLVNVKSIPAIIATDLEEYKCCRCQITTNHCVGWFSDGDANYCNKCAIKKMDKDMEFLRKSSPKQPAEPEIVGDGEYQLVKWKQLTSDICCGLEWFIQHIKSKAMVSMPFPNRADAEGFLKWWQKTIPDVRIHRTGITQLEHDFARYKVATTEVEYRCQCCHDGGAVEKFGGFLSKAGLFQLRCVTCHARSSYYVEQPPEPWIHRKESA